MSNAPLLSLVRDRFFDRIEEQAHLLRGASRRRVVVCCDERLRGGSSAWARGLADAIFLEAACADASDPDLQEAIRFAIESQGVEEVILVAHTACRHRKRAEEARSSASRSSNIVWLRDRLASHREELQQAKDEVRASVGQLRWALGEEVGIVAAVELGETGALLGYVETDDEFEAI